MGKTVEQIAEELYAYFADRHPDNKVYLFHNGKTEQDKQFDPREVFGYVAPETPLHHAVISIHETRIPGQPYVEYKRYYYHTWADTKYMTDAVREIITANSFVKLVIETNTNRSTYQTFEHAYERHLASIDEDEQE